ncbi:MAG: Lar family restriction alleviation protein [Nitrospirota bacterium]
MVKLLPCPFCGNEAKLYEDSEYASEDLRKYSVSCTGCSCSLGALGDDHDDNPEYLFSSKEEAIKAWNTRV